MVCIMTENQYAIVDVETTGFKPHEGHSIIEIAAEKLVGEKVVDAYHSLVMTDMMIEEESLSIHGITNDTLNKEGRPDSLVIPELVDFLSDHILIGHNIGFDLAFINAHLTKLNLPMLTNRTIDTVELARKYLIIPSYSLKKVAAYLKVHQPSAHRAQVDVEVTRNVFIKLNERAQAKGRKIDIKKGSKTKPPAIKMVPEEKTSKLF